MNEAARVQPVNIRNKYTMSDRSQKEDFVALCVIAELRKKQSIQTTEIL
jgi:hypothetical protein